MATTPSSDLPLYSLVIPLHNEEECLVHTLKELSSALRREGIPHELVAVEDNSTDQTRKLLLSLSPLLPELVILPRSLPRGFGRAVKDGIAACRGEFVAIVMGDASDDPRDVVSYYRVLQTGAEAAFGSRFLPGSVVQDYPHHKLLINRIANTLVRILFWISYNDITNAFKAYRRDLLRRSGPFLSDHFNITVEIPLKVINRGARFQILPIHWYGRKSGVSKLRLRELSRKYLYSLLLAWMERFLLDDEIRSRIP